MVNKKCKLCNKIIIDVLSKENEAVLFFLIMDQNLLQNRILQEIKHEKLVIVVTNKFNNKM